MTSSEDGLLDAAFSTDCGGAPPDPTLKASTPDSGCPSSDTIRQRGAVVAVLELEQRQDELMAVKRGARVAGEHRAAVAVDNRIARCDRHRIVEDDMNRAGRRRDDRTVGRRRGDEIRVRGCRRRAGEGEQDRDEGCEAAHGVNAAYCRHRPSRRLDRAARRLERVGAQRTVTVAIPVGVRLVRRDGHEPVATPPPGCAAVAENAVKSPLSQKRSFVPLASRGRTSEKRPFASGQRADTGLITRSGRARQRAVRGRTRRVGRRTRQRQTEAGAGSFTSWSRSRAA